MQTVQKKVKIKSQPRPEYHVYVYLYAEASNEVKMAVMGLSEACKGEWTGEGTDGRIVDISFSFQDRRMAEIFTQQARILPVKEVDIGEWDGEEYKKLVILH